MRQAQKLEAVGQLTGGIAHDFNNLLAVILGNAEFREERSASNRKFVQQIIQAAKRGAELTQRLLAFGRRQPLRPQAFYLGEVLHGLLDVLKRTLGEAIEIDLTIPANLWSANADIGQVEAALLNLAINARDAMPTGGRLAIACSNASIGENEAEQGFGDLHGDFILMSVSDTGTGMPDAKKEKVFEPFFTTKDVGKGSGLGLSMVFGFAKQTGGHVTVASQEGKGTTFRLYLPRAQ